MEDWLKYLIIAIVAVIVFWIVSAFVNRAFIRKYGFSLYPGGFFMAIAAGLIAGGLFLTASSGVGWVLAAAGAVILLIILIYDFKKAGFGGGLLALILQIIFCAPALLLVFDLLFNHGRTFLGVSRRNDRAMRDYRNGQNRE